MQQPEMMMVTAEVASRLGVSSEAVRYHDRELRPYRTPTGQRIYTSPVVDGYLAERDARRHSKGTK
ncbi:MAG: hypothetical protein KIT31_13880 [Deltaproteobacteria bacterium]|nr:hypothetical protein [Deltaproteobacteria bacterium]